jgi:hypothetical protein
MGTHQVSVYEQYQQLCEAMARERIRNGEGAASHVLVLVGVLLLFGANALI